MQMGKNGALGPAAAVVLTGGRSRRMGRDKARLPWGATSLLEHVLEAVRAEFDSVLLSAAAADEYPDLGVPVVADPVPGAGPLAGVVAALEAVDEDWLFATACDMPCPDAAVWRALAARAHADSDAIVPRTARGLEPLCAFYHRRCLAAFRRRLETTHRALHEAVADVQATIVEADQLPAGAGARAFVNVNTPAEYAAAAAERER